MCPKCGNAESIYFDPEGFIACNLCGMKCGEAEVIERLIIRPRAEAFAQSFAAQIPGVQINVPVVQWCGDHAHAHYEIALPRPMQFIHLDIVFTGGKNGEEGSDAEG